MTVNISHQVCESLVQRDMNSLSLFQSTHSRGLKMQKIKIPQICEDKARRKQTKKQFSVANSNERGTGRETGNLPS